MCWGVWLVDLSVGMDVVCEWVCGDEGEMTAAAAFRVKARRVEGADVGLVVLEDENVMVVDLKCVLWDVLWLVCEMLDGVIGDGDEVTSFKSASSAYLRVVFDGKILELDLKVLKWCGFVSGEVCIVYFIVSENVLMWGEMWKWVLEVNKDASAT